MTKWRRDRPVPAEELRWYKVTYRHGEIVTLRATHRAEARHYSKSYRADTVSSKDNYRDIVSCRMVARLGDEAPF